MSNEAKTENKPAITLSEVELTDVVNSNVAKILSKQGVPDGKARWTKKDHLSLILRLMVECGLEKENVPMAGQLLATAGIGGNQSQFTQSKYLKGKIARETLSEALTMYDVE